MIHCLRCQTVNPTEARFCLNCGLSLSRKCSNCQSELLPGARFCMYCGQPVIVESPLDANRFNRVAASAPEPLVQKALASTLSGERRVVTILFVDVVGSTALSEQVDVETWSEIMNEAIDQVSTAVYRYEGTIARLLGDSLLAFFGAPVAHEDDPVRAVHAALDLMATGQQFAARIFDQYGINFALRATINTGQVLVGPVGDDLHFDYTAMGGAVNLTSRLKFASQPMSVLVSEHTYRYIDPLFECEDQGPVSVKGISEPVRVYRVLSPRTQPGSLRGLVGLSSPMVGRVSELQTLQQLCEAVRAGLGRAVLVLGEPGLGKTRLISEWRASLAADQRTHGQPVWIEGRCLSYGQGLAYHLLIDLMYALIDVPDLPDEPQAHQALLAKTQDLFGQEYLEAYAYLGHLLSLRLEPEALAMVNTQDPQVLQNQYLTALQRLLTAMASRQPLVLVLEDLHWADPSSVALLTRLLPMASGGSMLFCLVSRPDRDAPGWRLITAAREMLGSSLTEISLNALSDAESRQLVSNLLAIEALPERVRRLILKKAEGNPFFVEEVIRMLIDRNAIVRRDEGWVAGQDIDKLEIPDNLQGLLLARIDRLPEDVRHVLMVAAVIGRQFPVKVLAQVLEQER